MSSRHSFSCIFRHSALETGLLLAILPALHFTAMRLMGVLNPALIWHGVMNYLFIQLIAAQILILWRAHAPKSAPGPRGPALLAALVGALYAWTGTNMEWLFLIFLPVLCLSFVSARRHRPVAFGLMVLLATSGVTFVHHQAFLEGVTKPWTEVREARMNELVRSGVPQGTSGCHIRGITYSLCLSFPDAAMDGFLDRPDGVRIVDELRLEQARAGGTVSFAGHDKNDDITVWAYGFDGEVWSILRSEDTLYRDRIVPAMGLLWWYGVLAWSSLALAIHRWHSRLPAARRRAAVHDVVGHAVIVALLPAAFACLAALPETEGIYRALEAADWRPEHLTLFQNGLRRVSLAISLAWISIGALIWAAHRRALRRRRNPR